MSATASRRPSACGARRRSAPCRGATWRGRTPPARIRPMPISASPSSTTTRRSAPRSSACCACWRADEGLEGRAMANGTADLDGKGLDGKRLGGKRPGGPPAQSFFRRRLCEAAGIVLFFAALLLAVALVSYDRDDPSWNHAALFADAPTHNWVGPYGARIADVLCQSLGAAPLILPLVLFAWSFRLLLYRGVAALWLRLALLPLTIVLAAGALALVPGPAGWLARGDLGGMLGKTLLGLAADMTHLAPPSIAMAAASLVGLALLYILGLSWRDC